MIEKIVDYSSRNTNPFLIQIFKDSNITGILEAGDKQFNELENTFFDLLDNLWIKTAIGEQLDVLGIHVGVDRDGRDDDSFRTLISVKAQLNAASPTPEILIQAIRTLFNATNVEYIPVYPAKVRIDQDGDLALYNQFQMELDDLGLLELDDSSILILYEADPIGYQILLTILPSGVGLLLTEDLILDDSRFLYLDDNGDHLLVSIEF